MTDIPNDDVQKYILATSDFAKSIQTDINHYVTRDRINDASLKQKLDPISKNILRGQNPVEVVFEDVSTFDAENHIVGSLLREIDLNKNQTDSDFIKSLPSQPGKNLRYTKDLTDQVTQRYNKKNDNNNNSNNNNNNDGGNLFPLHPPGPGNSRPGGDLGFAPAPPTIQDFIAPYPEEYDLQK